MIALSLPFLIIGCDASLNPFAEETGLYSIYGYLTLSEEPHYIRVKDLNDRVLDGSPQVIDAVVTLRSLETGATETLVDSIVMFNGLSTHNFRSEMELQPEGTYEVSVHRSDGQSSRTTATMPPLTVTSLTPSQEIACNALIDVEFPNIDDARFIRAFVGFKYAKNLEWIEIPLTELDTGGLRHRFKPASLVDEVVPDHVTPYANCEAERYCNLLDDHKIRIAYTHFGPDWPADSTLADPLDTEVENGLGVLAGLRRDTIVGTTNAELRCSGPESVPCSPVPSPCTGGGTCYCPDV